MILVGSDGERITLGEEESGGGGILVPSPGPPGKDSTVPGPAGRSVDGISVSGDSLVFDMSQGPDITLPVPAIAEANDAAGRAESAAERSEQIAAGIQDVAEDAAQVAEDRLAVESAASAVAADRQTVTDALNVVVTAKGDVEQIQTDVHQTKTSIENTANLVDQTLEQYGAQFVTERELSQQAVTDATTQAQRAEDAAEGIIAGSVLDNAVTTPKLADEAVTKTKTSPSVQTSLGKADTSVQEGDSRLTDARPPTANSHPVADVTGLQGALDGKAPTSHMHAIAQVTGLADALAAKMTEAQTDAIATAAIAAWVDNAPEALDTLAELAAALGNDPNFATTVMAAIGQRAMASHAHDAVDIADASTVGRNVMKAADAAAARTAIGAGTGNGNSNLALGTTSSTAMRGDGIQPVAALPGSPVAGILYCIPE